MVKSPSIKLLGVIEGPGFSQRAKNISFSSHAKHGSKASQPA